MKKILFLFLVLTSISHAQIGIGTNSPHPSAILDLSSSKKGLLLPRVAKATDVNAPTNGMLIYDLDLKCIRFYENGTWSPCLISVPKLTADCASSTLAGTYTNGVAMTAANKYSVTFTNNASSAVTLTFQPSDLVLSGISGITVASVSVASATVNPGASQLIEYTLSGSPTAIGTLTATWKKVTLSCVKTIAVTSNPNPVVLDCSGVAHNGTLAQGTSASGVTTTIPYTGGNGAAYLGQTVSSTGVTGLTATLTAGSFATGAGTLTYTITGTPSDNGKASFTITMSGQSCTFTRNVNPSIMPTTISLAQDRSFFVLSVYDQDYLPYTAPVTAATTNTQAADGTNEATTLNIQGTITTAGVTVRIPVTAIGTGTLPAYSNIINVPASMTQDGVSRNLTLSWPSTAFTSATKYITATIAAIGGTLNAKQLDLNAGTGTDRFGMVLGQFKYPYDDTLTPTTYTVRVFPGIPDKMFDQLDNTPSRLTHLMLYAPIYGEDGNLWLSNNLGARYANINAPSFNPMAQSNAYNDSNAYGSIFQWGRKADGHELVNYSTGVAVNGSTATLNNNPTNALFITGGSNSNWRTSADPTLWSTEASANNPCPVGFRVPTESELSTLQVAAGITTNPQAVTSLLRFSMNGYRDRVTGNYIWNDTFYTWSNTSSGNISKVFYSAASSAGILNFYETTYGFGVRCIKN